MRYRFFYWWVKIAVRIFYKNIQVVGVENIPKAMPVIFALNHQNSLLDALVMAVSVSEPVHFMTRADIFKKPRIARFLKSLNLIPIYRIRDGYGALAQNEEVISHCIDLMRQDKHILIFPEGSHNYQRHLRPLKKGIARIAVDAVLENQKEVLVIPVGLNYGSHKHSRSWLHVQIGSPISVQQSLSLFDNHKAKAENDLMARIEAGLKDQMVHFEEVVNYTEANDAAKLVLQHSNVLPKNYFERYRAIVDRINNIPESERTRCFSKMAVYRGLLEKHKIKRSMMGWASRKISPGWFWGVLGFLPFVVLGKILFFPPLWAYRLLIRKFKDRHWEASMKVVSIMVFYPLWMILVTIISAIFTSDSIVLLLVVGGVVALAFFSVLLGDYLEKMFYVMNLRWMKRKCPNDFKAIVNLETEILQAIG